MSDSTIESFKIVIPAEAGIQKMLDSHFHGNDTLSVWMQLSVKFLIWTKVICSEKYSLTPFCHYEKLEEGSTKKGKKKYFITIARPHIDHIERFNK